MAQDPIQNSNNKDENGQFNPQYPGDLGRPLTHDEMDYNLDLIGQIIKGYAVMGTGPNGDIDLTDDVEKTLKLHQVAADDSNLLENGAKVGEYVWIPTISDNTGDQGPQGPQGIAGPQGNIGVQGSLGPQGAAGQDGSQGSIGDQGLKGDQGDQGIRGFQGDAGDQGAKGDQGSTGNQGPAGDQGNDGAQGFRGFQGDKGDAGDQGFQGYQGPTGQNGLDGDQGDRGFQGIDGSQGSPGWGVTMQGSVSDQGQLPPVGNNAGDAYLNQEDDSLWIWDGTQWVSGGSIQGPQGPQGIGFQGFDGPQGFQGFQGAVGSQGFQGIDGSTGDQGFQGAVGANGFQGYQGIDGSTGDQGFQGFQGDTGSNGFQGFQGFTGDQGVGFQGFQGFKGDQGDQGTSNVIEYASLTVIPASEECSAWVTGGHQWRDAFIVIPQQYVNGTIVGVNASYGDAWPTQLNQFDVEIRNTLNVVVNTATYSHLGGSRSAGSALNIPITSAGFTINLNEKAGANYEEAKGYTITLKIQL